MAKFKLLKSGKVVGDVVVTVTAADEQGLLPARRPQKGFAATWARFDQHLKYNRVRVSGSYVFPSADAALAAGVQDALTQLGGDELSYVSGHPEPDPKAMFASHLADLQDRLQRELLEPFAQAIHDGDEPRVEAYRVLMNQLRAQIDQLEQSLEPSKK